MKPHPRIRKTVKWSGAAVAALLLGVWIASAWFEMYASPAGLPYEGFAENGTFHLRGLGGAGSKPGLLYVAFKSSRTPFEWSFWGFTGIVRGMFELVFPIWALLCVAVISIAIACHFGSLARRRTRVNLCPNREYDRAGLAAGEARPECGSGGSAAVKPRPMAWKTVTWAGAAVTALLLAILLVSIWCEWSLFSGNYELIVNAGKVDFSALSAPFSHSPFIFYIRVEPRSARLPFEWWFFDHGYGRGSRGMIRSVIFPAWIIVMVAIIPIVLAWRLDTLARRGAGLNLCPKCKYDRTGLVAGAVCPECGKLPA